MSQESDKFSTNNIDRIHIRILPAAATI